MIAAEILKEIRTRLKFLLDVGLDYLSLNRTSVSLSGGESQRIRLATQIGSQLVNVLYILDEPSIGLHQRDNLRLINSLKKLRDTGNSVIVVEHDKDMMLAADYVVDMGPKAGRLGGEVVFQGTPKQMLQTGTLTSKYLNGQMKIEIPAERRPGNGKSLWLRGAKGNNLKNVDVEFPLGKLICVTGVSGSGKSTLINDTLQPILSQHFYRSLQEPLPYDSVEGLDYIDKVVNVDQSPLGRTPRSNPATYTGVFSDIRNLFVGLPEAKIRGYKPGRFSFNVTGGRCEACGGNGYKTIEMNFLPDVLVPCEVCHGKRYNRETLEVRYKGKSIADVLDMTINRAVEFFENVPQILNKIKVLQEVGLGYIKLGQPSTTLSGGESQRVKLATELSKRDTGKTMYILDEPTTGLHFEDIRVLMNVLNKLVEKAIPFWLSNITWTLSNWRITSSIWVPKADGAEDRYLRLELPRKWPKAKRIYPEVYKRRIGKLTGIPAMKEKIAKTNVARLLDKAKIAYELIPYEVDENDLSAVHVAASLGENIEQVFKTLVLHGDKSGYFVCVIPGEHEVDLKMAAKVSGNKKCDLIPMKELLPLTGYIRGGCSPIGMKKHFPTYIHETCITFPFIYISAGIRGLQIKIAPDDLIKETKAEICSLFTE